MAYSFKSYASDDIDQLKKIIAIQQAQKAELSRPDEDWKDLAYQGGLRSYGSRHTPGQYYKSKSNRVYLRGIVVQSTGLIAERQIIATLPEKLQKLSVPYMCCRFSRRRQIFAKN